MQETVLMYHIDEHSKNAMTIIFNQLGVKVIEIQDNEINQQMGYLLQLNGYKKAEETKENTLKEPFLYFAFFTEQQIDIVLEVFKHASIPYIPYKAMLTNDNIMYTFEELYKNVEHEYQSMTNSIDKNK